MNTLKILIVDNESQYSKVYSSLSLNEEYEIEYADTAEKATQLMASRPPHLVVADLGNMDDDKKIRNLATNYNISIICASAIQNATKLNLSDSIRILTKPFNEKDLQITVRSVLRNVKK